MGRRGGAFAAAAEVAETVLVTGMEGPLAWAAETVAVLLAREGQLGAAATLSGYALRVLPAVCTRFGARRAVYLEHQQRLAMDLPTADRASLCTAGAAWSLHQAAMAVATACKGSGGDRHRPGER